MLLVDVYIVMKREKRVPRGECEKREECMILMKVPTYLSKAPFHNFLRGISISNLVEERGIRIQEVGHFK